MFYADRRGFGCCLVGLIFHLSGCSSAPEPQITVDGDMSAQADLGGLADLADSADDGAQDVDMGSANAPQGCPSDIVWRAGTAFPKALDHHASFITTRGEDAALHVVGGANYQGFFDEHWVATIQEDGSLEAWRQGAKLPGAMAGQAVAQVGQEVFLLGGRDAISFNDKVWRARFDAAGEIEGWDETLALPAPRFHGSAAVDGRRIIMSGGIDASGDAQRDLYTTQLNEDGSLAPWQRLALPVPRSHHSSFVYDGRFVVFMGFNGNPFSNQTVDYMGGAAISVDALVAEQGGWQAFAGSQYGISTHATTVLGQCALRIGGLHIEGGGQSLTYEPSVDAILLAGDDAGTISKLPSALSVGRSHMHQAPHHRGFLYVVGGSQALRDVTDRVEIGQVIWP